MTEARIAQKTMAYDGLKLYGIAIAAIPVDDNRNVLAVTITTIAVSYNDRSMFEIVDGLSFKSKVDLTRAKGVFDCFIRTVNLFERVVTLQREALAKYNLPYRPVPLDIGQTSFRPVPANRLYVLLFGPKSSHRKSPKAEKARDQFLAAHPAGYRPHIHACQKLAELAGCFSLKWGSFFQKHVTFEDYPKTDKYLLRLKRLMDKGSEKAYYMLCLIAEHYGKMDGEKHALEGNPNLFGIAGPDGYEKDKAMQAKHPFHGAYLDWHPDIRAAFLDAYNKARNSPHTVTLKLPCDLPSPPFTNPCADRIRDQLQIIDGERAADKILDAPAWRKYIADVAWEEYRPATRRPQRFKARPIVTEPICSTRRANYGIYGPPTRWYATIMFDRLKRRPARKVPRVNSTAVP
jgi:hypothetical protein